MPRSQKVGSIYTEIRAKLDRLSKDLAAAQSMARRDSRKMQQYFDRLNFDKSTASLRRFYTLLTASAAGLAFKRLASGAVETASFFERAEAKLETLTGSGAAVLEELNQMALKLPISTKDAVDAFVMMQAMGLEPTRERMLALIDAATVLGDDVLKRVALQLGQTAAMGKLMGQEIRVLGEAGIDVRTILQRELGMSVKQVQESGMDIQVVLDAIFKGIGDKFGGSAARMSKSWSGMVAIFKSYVVELERQVMSNGVFDQLKKLLDEINQGLFKFIQLNSKLISKDINDNLATFVKHLKDIANTLITIKTYGDFAATVFNFLATGGKGGSYQAMKDMAEKIKRRWAGPDLMSSHGATGGLLPRATAELQAAHSSLGRSRLAVTGGGATGKDPLAKIFPIETSEQYWSNFFDDIDKAKKKTVEYRAEMEKTLEAYHIDEWAAMFKENEELLDKMKEQTKEAAERWRSEWQYAIDYTSDAIADFVLTGKLGFEELMKSILAGFVRLQANKLFSKVADVFMGALFPTAHQGGLVGAGGHGGSRRIPASSFSFAPRLHSGLMPDEYPAVLQKGEMVLPKDAQGGGGTNIYINAVDAQSFTELVKRNPSAIAMVVENNLKRNGGIRKRLHGTL